MGRDLDLVRGGSTFDRERERERVHEDHRVGWSLGREREGVEMGRDFNLYMRDGSKFKSN